MNEVIKFPRPIREAKVVDLYAHRPKDALTVCVADNTLKTMFATKDLQAILKAKNNRSGITAFQLSTRLHPRTGRKYHPNDIILEADARTRLGSIESELKKTRDTLTISRLQEEKKWLQSFIRTDSNAAHQALKSFRDTTSEQVRNVVPLRPDKK